MSEKNVTVSIIIATYNRANFIVETLHSIINQTFKDFECLIIDDGSTDNTIDVIKPIIDTDHRFIYKKRPENYLKGLPGARNFGLDTAKGEYIIFFDDDDIVHAQNLSVTTNLLAIENVDFCAYEKQSFEPGEHLKFKNYDSYIKDYILSDNDLKKVVTNEIGLASCTVLWKKKVFKDIRFNENLQYAEEWECYIKILLNGFVGQKISNILYFNQKHMNSNTGEFYQNKLVRRKSKADAILLVVVNLLSKKRLSYSILRYFVAMSYNFREFLLFESILDKAKLTFLKKIYWRFFFLILPLRLILHRFKRKISKKKCKLF